METSSSSSPSSTPTPLSMAPPAGQPSELSKMQQEPPAAPDGPPIEAVAASHKSTASSSSSSSSSRAIAIPQSRDSIYLRREKEVAAPVNPAPRTDSIDSYVSYRNSFRSGRTDTGFTQVSAITDFTDITETSRPSSPERDNFHDGPIIFEESDASSHRPFANPGRTVAFGQDNCRPAPYSSSPDTTSLLRHSAILRQDRSSSPRRGILRSTTGFNPPRPNSLARRGSNQWPAQLPYRPRLSRHTIQESAEDTKELPTPTEPSQPAARFEEPSETIMIRQIEQDDPIEDVGLSSLSVEDTQTTEAVTEEMSDTSDSTGDIGTPTSSASGSRPDDQIVQDTCNHVLKNVFGVDLQELGVTGAASAAYDSVHYCLDELWHLVPGENSANQWGPPLREVPNYGNARGGGHAPIRPGNNGSEPNNFQAGGGGGEGHKRPNGDGDQGDQGRQNGNGGGKRPPGDRDNGGGGKRTKIAAAEEATHDQKLSCPFRKRNPAKFNVRDHQSCAVQSFPDISQLKRHVKNFHKQRTISPFACPRCKRDMLDSEGLQNHLHVPNERICTPQEVPPDQDPENGITSRIEDMLNGRKANTKIDTWEVLWPTLFPGDSKPKDPHFVPPVELEEVQSQFETLEPELYSSIRQMEQNANCFGQTLDERVNRIVAICSQHIQHVMEQSRLRAYNTPGRPRRNRSHGHGQNPKSTSKGKSPETQGSGLSSGSEASPSQVIPKKEGQGTSLNDSSLSSSLETANSDELWSDPQPRGQKVLSTMPTPAFDQYPDLNIDINDTLHTEIGDVPLSAATTRPAGSPHHLISPQIGPGNTPVTLPPQDHPHNMFVNGFPGPFNGGQSQTPVPNVLDSQYHNRTDSGVSGIDATTAPYFRPSPASTNANMFPVVPTDFPGMPTAMGYGGPSAPGQMHPQHMQPMQQRQQHMMQVPFRQPQAASQFQQMPVTIDPRMIDNKYGMGNNGANFGHAYNGFAPEGSNGTS